MGSFTLTAQHCFTDLAQAPAVPPPAVTSRSLNSPRNAACWPSTTNKEESPPVVTDWPKSYAPTHWEHLPAPPKVHLNHIGLAVWKVLPIWGIRRIKKIACTLFTAASLRRGISTPFGFRLTCVHTERAQARGRTCWEGEEQADRCFILRFRTNGTCHVDTLISEPFGCIYCALQVDTSHYAIPSVESVTGWVGATPKVCCGTLCLECLEFWRPKL